MSSYVPPLQISPSTMVNLADDGEPLQPPHPTKPLYTRTETSTPPDAFKCRAKQCRIPIELTEQSCGRKTYIQPSLVVLMTMEINTTPAGHDTIPHMAKLTKDSHVLYQPTMPLQTLPSSPFTQHHTHSSSTPKDQVHKQSTCRTGKLLVRIQHPDNQNHDQLLLHANKGQMEAQTCHTLCGRPLHTVKPAPADNHAHHLTPTNTSPNKQPETPKKCNLHLYQPLPNSPTTADAEHTAKDTAHHCNPSLHHNQHFTFYTATP